MWTSVSPWLEAAEAAEAARIAGAAGAVMRAPGSLLRSPRVSSVGPGRYDEVRQTTHRLSDLAC